MDIPGNNTVLLADLPSIDATVGTRVFVQDADCFYEAVSRSKKASNAVDGPADALTPISWQQAGLIVSTSPGNVASYKMLDGFSASAGVASVVPAHFSQIQIFDSVSSWWTGLSGLTAVSVLDARHTLQAAGAIATWDNRLGSNDATQATPANKPTLDIDGWLADGGAAVVFDSAAPSYMDQNGIAASLVEPYTLVSVVSVPAAIPAAQGDIFGSSGTTNGAIQWYHENTTGKIRGWRRDSAASVTQLVSAGALSANTPTQLAFVVNGASSYLIVGDAQTTGALGAGATDTTAVRIGSFPSASLPFNGSIRGIAAFSGAATPAQCASIARHLNGASFARVVIDGNSMSVPSAWPAYLPEYLGSGSVEAYGVSAQTTAAMLADYASEIAPRYTTVVPTVLFVWEISNDIYFGATAAEALSRIFRYLDLARDTGFLTVLISVLPRVQFTAAQETIRQTVNAALDRYARAHCDAYIPIHRMGPWTNYNSSMFDDGIHPGVAGARDIAKMAAHITRELVG